MTGYTKLFGSIIASTIWQEDDKTRIVWITMLAMKNKFHIVEASIPGLATFAHVTAEECRATIAKLESPDPDSRSEEHEGRRIKKVEGGWLILNGEKYREKMNADERREANRLYQQRYRKKSVSINSDSKQMSALSAHAEAEAQTEAIPPKPPICVSDFEAFWNAYPKKSKMNDAREAWTMRLAELPPLLTLLSAIEAAKQTDQWQDKNGRYIPKPGDWLRDMCWLDEHQNGQEAQGWI